MKKVARNAMLHATMVLAMIIICSSSIAQLSDKDKKLIKDSRNARKEFIHSDSSMKKLFASAYGYVIFPKIAKGAFLVGGAGGEGVLFQNDSALGRAHVSQVTVGLQAGGQDYREVIFFENKEAFDGFKANKFEFSGQVSAVAVKSGSSANAKYEKGTMVFTQQIGGLMVEASVGGQKFKFTPFKK